MWWAKILEILRAVYDGASSLNVTLTTPPAAGGVGQANFTVHSTQGALSGTNARGFLLFNNSSGGQTIYFGDTGLSASTGFPLRAGDAIDRPTWQDLSVVFALASADGADLRAVPL